MSTLVDDVLEGDEPCFDPQCPKCGRFYGKTTYWVNGVGDVVRTEANCSRCGPIAPSVSHWKSDREW